MLYYKDKMQELIIFFLIAFAIIASILFKSSHSFDNINDADGDIDTSVYKKREMPIDYIHNTDRYNKKYYKGF